MLVDRPLAKETSVSKLGRMHCGKSRVRSCKWFMEGVEGDRCKCRPLLRGEIMVRDTPWRQSRGCGVRWWTHIWIGRWIDDRSTVHIHSARGLRLASWMRSLSQAAGNRCHRYPWSDVDASAGQL